MTHKITVAVRRPHSRERHYFVTGAVFVGIGLPAFVGIATFAIDPVQLTWSPGMPGAIAAMFALVGLVLLVSAALSLEPARGTSDSSTSEVNYRRHLVGLGFAVLVLAGSAITLFAGLTYTCFSEELFAGEKTPEHSPHPELVFKLEAEKAKNASQPGTESAVGQEAVSEESGSKADAPASPLPNKDSPTEKGGAERAVAEGPAPSEVTPDPKAKGSSKGQAAIDEEAKLAQEILSARKQRLARALALLLSLVMALIGGMFFVVNSLNDKRQRDTEPFDDARFWGGLWYRLGEAVLFTLVIFLLMRPSGGPRSVLGLPIMALFMGMFVTTGERLVFGMARRFFQAASTLLPLHAEDVDAAFKIPIPSAPQGVTAERTEDGTSVLVKWRPAEAGAVVRGFVIRHRRFDGDWEKTSAGPNATEATISGLDTSVGYKVRVAAFNDAGESDPSDIVEVLPKLASPLAPGDHDF